MKAKISLVTIWTNDIETMKNFYSNVLKFRIINDLGDYVEFKNEGVRFAICMRKVMYDYSERFKDTSSGQAFKLAFPCESIVDLDNTYTELIDKGAVAIQKPKNMPWNQRTALFADPDGNIYEIFVEL